MDIPPRGELEPEVSTTEKALPALWLVSWWVAGLSWLEGCEVKKMESAFSGEEEDKVLPVGSVVAEKRKT